MSTAGNIGQVEDLLKTLNERYRTRDAVVREMIEPLLKELTARGFKDIDIVPLGADPDDPAIEFMSYDTYPVCEPDGDEAGFTVVFREHDAGALGDVSIRVPWLFVTDGLDICAKCDVTGEKVYRELSRIGPEFFPKMAEVTIGAILFELIKFDPFSEIER